MKVIESDTDNIITTVSSLLSTNECGVVICIPSKSFFVCGQYGISDIPRAEEHDLIILPFNQYCGSCVVFNGDLNILVVQNGFSDIGRIALEKIRDYVISKDILTLVCGNDLMLYTKEKLFKIGSYASIRRDTQTITIIHISINTNLDLIQEICKSKPMEKIPGALGDYNIAANEILEVIKPLLN